MSLIYIWTKPLKNYQFIYFLLKAFYFQSFEHFGKSFFFFFYELVFMLPMIAVDKQYTFIPLQHNPFSIF